MTEKERQKEEKKRLIEEAGRCLKDGLTIRGCKSDRLKKAMQQVAANAALIDMCHINQVIVSNICDGDFESIQDDIDDIIDTMASCMAIISKKGEEINQLLTDEEIDNAVNFTIFEQTRESEIENGKTD